MNPNEEITELNIAPDNVDGPCTLKCAYSFSYPDLKLTGSNKADRICIKTNDPQKNPPVTYNTFRYIVSEINLYSPSLHFYNGDKTTAELIVKHIPEINSETSTDLYVCIPIIVSGDTSSATTLVTQLIQEVASKIPSPDDDNSQLTTIFNLQDIIPKKPFYKYTNSGSQMVGDYIVFGLLNAIPITAGTASTLSNILTNYVNVFETTNLFLSEVGPNSSSNEGIYISCQPTGSSDEKIDVVTPNEPYDYVALLQDPFVKFLIHAIIITIICIVIYGCIKLLKSWAQNKGSILSNGVNASFGIGK